MLLNSYESRVCLSREIGTKTSRQWPSGARNLLPVFAVEQRIDQHWRCDEAVRKSRARLVCNLGFPCDQRILYLGPPDEKHAVQIGCSGFGWTYLQIRPRCLLNCNFIPSHSLFPNRRSRERRWRLQILYQSPATSPRCTAPPLRSPPPKLPVAPDLRHQRHRLPALPCYLHVCLWCLRQSGIRSFRTPSLLRRKWSRSEVFAACSPNLGRLWRIAGSILKTPD
jgi:hypothetical protein